MSKCDICFDCVDSRDLRKCEICGDLVCFDCQVYVADDPRVYCPDCAPIS